MKPFWIKYRALILLELLAVALWVIYYSATFHGILQNDALDYAQMGRELYRGHGLSSKTVFPSELSFFRERGFLARGWWPNLHRFPLPAILNASAYVLFGPSDFAVAAVSGIFYLLALAMLFLLADRLFDRGVAIGASVLFLISREMLDYSQNGMTESTAIFFLLLILLLLLDQGRLSRNVLWAGIAAGLAYLNRTNMIVFLPLLVAFVFVTSPTRRVRNSLVFLAACGAMIAPWLIRNAIVGGSPFASFTVDRVFMAATYYEGYDPAGHLGAGGLVPTLLASPQVLVGKWIRNAASLLYWHFFPLEFSYIVPFMFVSIFHSYPGQVNRIRWLVYVLIGVQALLLSFGLQVSRYYLIFVPFALVMGVKVLLDLLRAANLRPFWRASVLVVLGGLAVLPTLQAIRRPAIATRRLADIEYIQECVRDLGPHDVVASYFSNYFAWFGDRYAVRMPQRPAELLTIESTYLPIKAVYVSPRLYQRVRKGEYEQEIEFTKSPDFLRHYYLARDFGDGAVYFVRREGKSVDGGLSPRP